MTALPASLRAMTNGRASRPCRTEQLGRGFVYCPMTLSLNLLVICGLVIVVLGIVLHLQRRPSGIVTVLLGGLLVWGSLGAAFSNDWARIQEARQDAIRQCLASG